MSNNDNTKKRRVGGGSARVSINGGRETGGSELAAIKSMMQELVKQNRTQTDMISNMQGKINNMQEEITQLSNKCNMIEQACNNTVTLNANMKKRFDGVDDKLQYHDILLQNQKWKYLAPYPWDYLDSIEADERSQAEKFLNEIKICTEEMRYGKGDGDICLSVTPVEYNEVFLPHWKEYANSLEQYHYHLKHSTEQRDNVSKLRLLGIELPDKVVDLLSNALKSTHFQKIVLRNNNFSQKGIEFVLDYLESNPNLKHFYLEGSPINSMDDINLLGKLIKLRLSIDTLALINCKGMDVSGFDMLKTIMNAGKNKLEHVNLCNNGISTEGGTFISDFLATDPILQSLYLEKNQLNDNDAIGIAEALKQNTKLCFLNLTGNNITKVGWKALRKAEFDDTSLNATSDCNHSCNMKYPPDDSDLIEGVDISEMNGDRNCTIAFNPTWARRKKLYSVLSSRNRDCSNVGNFDDDMPVELLPHMLHSIHCFSNYRDGGEDISQVRDHAQPLSIVYEICRHWDESLVVFEALSL